MSASRIVGCCAALVLGSVFGSACNLLAECNDLEPAPNAALVVAEVDGLEVYLGATVDLSPYDMTIEFEDPDGNRWSVTYDVAIDF